MAHAIWTEGDVLLMMRAVEDAYRDARYRARATSTIRLRFAERRLRAQADRLSQPELAALTGLRDELRDRGIEVPDLWPG